MKRDKINVLHIADKFGVRGSSICGVTRLLSWWFPRFDTNEFDVRLIELREEYKACQELKQQGIDVVSLGKGKFDFSTIMDIVRIVRRQKTDILHLHGYGSTNFGRMATKIIKVKSIVHEHFVDPAMPIYQAPFDYFLSRVPDFSIAVSSSVKEFMVKKRFLPEDKVKVVFNGAPLSDFRPIDKKMAAKEKKRWLVPDNYKIIATIGRVDEQKGSRYFIDAANKLLQKRANIKFMIIGDGPLLMKLKEQCNKFGIQNDVILTGYQSDIPTIQSIIDIQVFPSLWEGTPLTLFEAMAMKRPIVSTNVDGLGEVLRHGENALVLLPRDSDAIADAIEHLLSNPDIAEKLSVQAKSDSRKFDIQNTVNELQLIYQNLMK